MKGRIEESSVEEIKIEGKQIEKVERKSRIRMEKEDVTQNIF